MKYLHRAIQASEMRKEALKLAMLRQPVKSLPKGTPVVLRDTNSCCYLHEIFRVLLP